MVSLNSTINPLPNMNFARKLGLVLAVAATLIAVSASPPAEAAGEARVSCRQARTQPQYPYGYIDVWANVSRDSRYTYDHVQYVRFAFKYLRWTGATWAPYVRQGVTDSRGWTRWEVQRVDDRYNGGHLVGVESPVTVDAGDYYLYTQYEWYDASPPYGHWYGNSGTIATSQYEWALADPLTTIGTKYSYCHTRV